MAIERKVIFLNISSFIIAENIGKQKNRKESWLICKS